MTDYERGVRDGIREYAWWKDGTQYVGTCGRTLEYALSHIEIEHVLGVKPRETSNES